MHSIPIVKSYHNSTREVDLHDQLCGHYAISNKYRKWWHYLFWFCLDVELWTLLFWRKKAINHLSRTHLAFHIELAQNLIGEFSNRRRTTRPGQSEDGHWPIALSKGQCKHCLKHRKTEWAASAAASAFVWCAFQTTLVTYSDVSWAHEIQTSTPGDFS